MSQLDREIESLEQQIEEAETEEDRRELRRMLGDIYREESDRERWEEEGRERGWQ